MKTDKTKPLSTFNVAKLCRVSHRTVQLWIDDGKLEAYKTPGKHNRVEGEDLVKFMLKYKMPIPKELSPYVRLKKRVLIVDDDPSIVFTLKGLLSSNYDCEIREAYGGFTAGKFFAEFKPDLVTLDINMPGLDGFEVCRMIKQDLANAHVGIMIISSMDDEETKKKVMDLGADYFLPKPLDSKDFLDKVNEMLTVKGISTDAATNA